MRPPLRLLLLGVPLLCLLWVLPAFPCHHLATLNGRRGWLAGRLAPVSLLPHPSIHSHFSFLDSFQLLCQCCQEPRGICFCFNCRHKTLGIGEASIAVVVVIVVVDDKLVTDSDSDFNSLEKVREVSISLPWLLSFLIKMANKNPKFRHLSNLKLFTFVNKVQFQWIWPRATFWQIVALHLPPASNDHWIPVSAISSLTLMRLEQQISICTKHTHTQTHKQHKLNTNKPKVKCAKWVFSWGRGLLSICATSLNILREKNCCCAQY